MICPECGGKEISIWYRSVNLDPFDTLKLIVWGCRECGWITVHNWKLVQQHKMSLENKEEVK